VRLSGGGFKSEFAAKLAGEKALSELRAGLAEQRPDPRDLPRPPAEDGDTPSCPHCRRPMNLVRTIPQVGSHPELLVFRCAGCNHVETKGAESTLEPVPPSADPCAGVLRARDPYIQPRAKEVRPSRMSPCEEMDEPANARHWPIPRVVK